jgi:hypothetical protein
MAYNDIFAESLHEELETIFDRLCELQDYSTEFGFKAVEHKIGESLGAIDGAVEAAKQYQNGTLKAND